MDPCMLDMEHLQSGIPQRCSVLEDFIIAKKIGKYLYVKMINRIKMIKKRIKSFLSNY